MTQSFAGAGANGEFFRRIATAGAFWVAVCILCLGIMTDLAFGANNFVHADGALAQQPATNADKAQYDSIRKALEAYDRAFQARDIDALRRMLSADIVMYEQGTQNRGRDDVLTNHLGPELLSFQELTTNYSDLRVLESGQMAVITRQFSLKAKRQGRPFFVRGTETQGWVFREGRWELAHIHLSFPPGR